MLAGVATTPPPRHRRRESRRPARHAGVRRRPLGERGEMGEEVGGIYVREEIGKGARAAVIDRGGLGVGT
jgi:hypothetical protein